MLGEIKCHEWRYDAISGMFEMAAKNKKISARDGNECKNYHR